MFKNATDGGTGMDAEELVWDDVHDDTALTSEEMIVMMNGEEVLVGEDGGFVAKSALDKELTDEDAEGNQELSDGVSEDSDEGVQDPMVIDWTMRLMTRTVSTLILYCQIKLFTEQTIFICTINRLELYTRIFGLFCGF